MTGRYLIALVGTQYRSAEAIALLAGLENGAPLTLVREPTNKIDYNAVQVWSGGVHLGYLKGSQNKPVANWMDTLRRARQSAVALDAKLSLKDGGKWPMVEVEW